MIASVLFYFEKEKNNGGPLLDTNKVMQRTADACGISLRTIQRINAEIKKSLENQEDPCVVEDIDLITAEDDQQDNTLNSTKRENIIIHTPRKKSLKRKRPVTDMDDFDKGAIRRHILSYYARKEAPTLRQLCVSLQEAGLYMGGKSSMSSLLSDMGFQYKKFNSRKILMEKPSVALLRCRFLRKMLEVNIKNTIFLDETWINENTRKDTGWTDGTIKGTLGGPLGKGKRLIICHAGGSNGWISAPPFVFQSKKTGDYHEDMNATVFESWFFDTLLPSIPQGATIVMDNAPYHSRILNKPPTSSSTKAEMISWLKARGVPFPDNLLKVELYALVRLQKPPTPTYVIDKKASELGFKVIRLPPYHCHYNPIEMVWANLKNYVKVRNTTFKLADIENLFRESVVNFTSDMWTKYVDHVEKLIDEDWRNEGLNDASVQELIVNLAPDDSDEDEYDDTTDEDDFGCAHIE